MDSCLKISWDWPSLSCVCTAEYRERGEDWHLLSSIISPASGQLTISDREVVLTQLQCVQLQCVQLQYVQIQYVQLQYVQLQYVQLQYVQLQYVQLQYAQLQYVQLQYSM